MEEDNTAQVKVTLTIKLTGEPGTLDADGNEINGVSAEDKADNIYKIAKDQVEAMKITYDQGVEVTGKITYVGHAEEDL